MTEDTRVTMPDLGTPEFEALDLEVQNALIQDRARAIPRPHTLAVVASLIPVIAVVVGGAAVFQAQAKNAFWFAALGTVALLLVIATYNIARLTYAAGHFTSHAETFNRVVVWGRILEATRGEESGA